MQADLYDRVQLKNSTKGTIIVKYSDKHVMLDVSAWAKENKFLDMVDFDEIEKIIKKEN